MERVVDLASRREQRDARRYSPTRSEAFAAEVALLREQLFALVAHAERVGETEDCRVSAHLQAAANALGDAQRVIADRDPVRARS